MIGIALQLLIILGLLDAPRFEAISAAKPEPVVGELSALTANGATTIGETMIPAGELIELRRVGAHRPLPPFDRPHILLANGDRWLGQVLGIADDRVRFAAELGSKQEVTVPLSAIVAMWLTVPRHDVEPKPADLDLSINKRGSDELTLTNGDIIRGTIANMEKGNIVVDISGKLQKLPAERVAAIALSTDLVKAPPTKGEVFKLALANGTRITLTDAVLQNGRIVGKSAAEQPVRLLLGEVSSVSIVGGRCKYLSELTPMKYEHAPYFSIKWALTRDRNSANGWMQLGKDSYDRGIGMHSQSVVVYAVPTGATRFESWVGMDTVAGARGSVKAYARLDGKDVFGPVELSAEPPMKRVVAPLTASSKELSLHVEFGVGADVQDHVNWADSRFVGATINRP